MHPRSGGISNLIAQFKVPSKSRLASQFIDGVRQLPCLLPALQIFKPLDLRHATSLCQLNYGTISLLHYFANCFHTSVSAFRVRFRTMNLR